MVKFMTTNSVFKYTWEQVAIGIWQRYPNPNSKHVLTEDVIARHTDGDKLFTKRMLTKTNKFPKWADRIVGNESKVLIIEESVVDTAHRTVTTYTRNVGKQDVANVYEKCVYRESPENSSWTVCERSGWVTSKLGFGLKRVVEMFVLQRFCSNVNRASQGFDYVLTNLFRPDVLKDHPLLSSSIIKEKARKAAELAKAKRSSMIAQTSS